MGGLGHLRVGAVIKSVAGSDDSKNVALGLPLLVCFIQADFVDQASQRLIPPRRMHKPNCFDY
jgi:hypothetical protein